MYNFKYIVSVFHHIEGDKIRQFHNRYHLKTNLLLA